MKALKLSPDELMPGENPRQVLFDSEEEKETFKDQMKRSGPELLRPLEVLPTEGVETKRKINSGHRRWHCAVEMKWEWLPCVELPRLIPKDAFIRSFATDYHRKNLDGYSLVKSIVKLKEKYELSQTKISECLGLSQSYVSELSTVDNCPELLNYLKYGGHISKAISLSKIGDITARIKILNSIDSYSTAQLREIAKTKGIIRVIKPPIETPRIGSKDDNGDSPSDLPPSLDSEETEETEVLDKGEGLPESERTSGSPNIPQDGSGEKEGVKVSDERPIDPEPEKIATPPLSKPSKFKRVYMCICGHYAESKKEAKDHDCVDGVQGFFTQLTIRAGRFLRPNRHNSDPSIDLALKPYNLSKDNIPHIDEAVNRLWVAIKADVKAWEHYKDTIRKET